MGRALAEKDFLADRQYEQIVAHFVREVLKVMLD